MNKTLAVFILAHKNYEQVERLVNRLNSPEIDIYIHCDARWNDGFERLKKIESDSIFVVNKRFETNLDTWRLIEAPIELVRFSKQESKREYKYYALVSGQDYPIISTDKIISELKAGYPKPFIDCTPYDKNNWVYYKFYTYDYFKKYCQWLNTKIKKGAFSKLLKFPVYAAEKYVINKVYCPKLKLDRLGVELYGGSAWWILPDTIINFIFDEYNKNDKYLQVLSTTMTPEETFFQIMSMRSPIADAVEVNPKEMVLQNCKTYAYFFDDKKQFKGHPYEFTMEDIDLLREKSKTCFFARKFDMNVDKDIFDYIDNELIKE